MYKTKSGGVYRRKTPSQDRASTTAAPARVIIEHRPVLSTINKPTSRSNSFTRRKRSTATSLMTMASRKSFDNTKKK